MTCFTVQVLEPSGKIIEVETCAGNTISNIVLQNYTSPDISISQCVAQLPSDFNDRVFAVVSGDIVASTGINISSSGDKIYLNSILDSDYGIDLTYSSGIYTIFATGLQPSGNYSLVGHQHDISEIINYDSAVSGLLPITNLIGGDNISIISSGSVFTVNASGLLPGQNIVGYSGIYVDNNSGIFNISTTGVPYIDNQGNLLTYINIDGGTP